MASFCVKCGSPLSGAFCVKCGADARAATNPAQGQTPSPAAQQTVPSLVPPGTAKKGMSPLAKLGIAAVAIIFVGGAAGAVGVYYVAHRVSQKIHQAADGILGSSSDSSTGSHGEGSGSGESESGRSKSGTNGETCRLLSKEDVSKAIGVEIVRTQPEDNGCTYIAKGTQAEMAAKHMKSMVGDEGGNKQAQDIAQKVGSGMFSMLQSQEPASEQDGSGEVPVFSFTVDQHAAEEQMRLNAKILGNLGSQQGLPGIGDQAFVSADGILFMRKGKTLVRILYLSCPCGTEQVKPLAKEIAGAL